MLRIIDRFYLLISRQAAVLLLSRKGQRGMSLLTVLVAVAISGVVATAMSQLMTSTFQAQKSAEIWNDREAIKQMLMQQIDCDRFDKNSCTSSGSMIELFRYHDSSQPYITKEGSGLRVGSWAIRAECESGNGGVIVRVNRLKPTAQINSSNPDGFLPHPITKEKMSWNDPRTLLFPAGVALCLNGGSGGTLGNPSQPVPGAPCGADNQGLTLMSGGGPASPLGVAVCCYAYGGGGGSAGTANGSWLPMCSTILN